jgi:serine phosphatase RsbU (regulator of sigma subunit)
VYEFKKGDFFYFFSDGIKDQFGGMHKRKMMKKGLLAILERVQHVAPERRNIEFEIALRKWQGSLPQTDDMLLLGFDPNSYPL